LAAATGTSPATVRRRLHDLRAGGVLRLDVDVDLAIFEAPVRTMVWLTVSLDQITPVGDALARSPEIAFAAATTGQSNLFASVSTRDPSALWRYLTDVIASLAGVNDVETAPAMRTVKAAATHFSPPARESRSPQPHAASSRDSAARG
ncbi:MAG: Lrp/AsnC family transcriptional regulator, partial [Solirubrobacteraceae bacterium]